MENEGKRKNNKKSKDIKIKDIKMEKIIEKIKIKTRKIISIFYCLAIATPNVVFAQNIDGLNPGEIKVDKTAKIKESDPSGRTAEVTLSIDGKSFTETNKTNVVLVLDRSNSMNIFMHPPKTRMDVAKERSKELINKILIDGNQDVKMGIVSFGTHSTNVQDLTSDKQILNDALNEIKIKEKDGATNVDAGLEYAYQILKEQEGNNHVILLSDGGPTKFNYNGGLYGTGEDDEEVCVEGFFLFCGKYMRPSEKAKETANKIKENNMDIFTVAFSNDAVEAIPFLKDVASDPVEKHFFEAADSEGLSQAFDSISQEINTIATNAIVTDKLPEGVELDLSTLPANATYDAATRTITWNIGNILAGSETKLSYEVKAKDGYYGSVNTNESALLVGVPAEGNPSYSENIRIEFPVPHVAFSAQTNDDDYRAEPIYQGEALTKDTSKGILTNDLLINKLSDAGATVTDRIVIIDNDGNLEVNEDGSFKFTASNFVVGDKTYNYYVETAISGIPGEETKVVKSNQSTISFKVLKSVNYIVKHLDEADDSEIIPEAEKTGYLGETVTEEALDIPGYKKLDPTTQTKDLVDGNNEIIFKYRKITYKVLHYLEKLDEAGYKLEDTEVLPGIAGEQTNAQEKTYQGFSLKSPIAQQEIQDDNTTVVEIYYKRNVHDIIYKIIGEYFQNNSYHTETGIKFGKDLELISDNMKKAGYTFSGWSAIPATMPDENVAIQGSYTANTDTAYVVKHYQENIGNDEFTLEEIENKTGTTGEETNAQAKTYPGFKLKEVVIQKEIAADGSTVIEIYYVRNRHNILYKVTGVYFANNNYKTFENVKYGTPLTLISDNMKKAGYTFSGWSAIPATMPDENVVIVGSYIQRNIKYIVRYVDKASGENIVAPLEREALVGETVEENAKSFQNYSLIGAKTQSITLDGEGIKEIVFYYNEEFVNTGLTIKEHNSLIMMTAAITPLLVAIFIKKRA